MNLQTLASHTASRLLPFLAAIAIETAPGAPAPSPSSEAVQQAARVALTQGVLALKDRAGKDPEGWVVPPGRVNKVIGSEQVPARFRQGEREVPVYEYKEVVTFQQSSSGEPPKKVVTRQPVRQTGTKKEPYLIPDPNGPIERKVNRPKYEKGGTTYWYAGTLGDAALATHALRKAGVPDSDPVVERMLENLQSHLRAHGLPDQTWNLAWLTVLFATTPGEDAEGWTQKLAGRLLDGQIPDGPARGLWGPMSIHPRLFAAFTADYLALNAEIAKREEKAKQRDTKTNLLAVSEAKTALETFQHLTNKWSRFALRFASLEMPLRSNPEEGLIFAGSSDFFYNQRSADLQSTWVALHALSVAAGAGRLPAQSPRPSPFRITGAATPGAAPAVPPETSANVLNRATVALAALQPADGRWNECNFHQPVTEFNSFTGTLPVPADPKSFPPLASPVTPVSVAQGAATLASLGRAVGPDKMGNLQAAQAKALAAAANAATNLLEGDARKPGARRGLGPEDYDLLLALATFPPSPDATPEARAQTDLLAGQLVLGGSPTGGDWSLTKPVVFLPSSSRARYEALKGIPNRVWKGGGSPVEMNSAHAYVGNVFATGSTIPILRDPAGFATATAVLYLARAVEDPANAVLELGADPGLAELRNQAEARLLGKAPPRPKPTPAAAPAVSPAPTTEPEVPAGTAPDPASP